MATLQAQFTAYQIPGGTVQNQAFSGPIGADFDVLTPISVTHLGVFDSGSDGLGGTETAYLWLRTSDTTGALLTSLSFDAGTGAVLVGGYRIKELASPLVLSTGNYTLSGDGYTDGIYNTHGLPGDFLAPEGAGATDNGSDAIAFVGLSRYQFPNVAGSFPDSVDEGPAYRHSIGTFQYVVVPEPSSLALAGLGAGLALALRRLRS